MELAYSINRVPIRLTEERWQHIVTNKPYMEKYFERLFEAIENPSRVLRGYAGANFIRLPKTKMWLDYDSGADVLYIHFEEKPVSTHSEMRDDGIILDYEEDRLVGLTVLEASSRA